MSWAKEQAKEGNEFPSTITLAVDEQITTKYSIQQIDIEAENVHGSLCNTALWSGGRWVLKHDSLSEPHVPSQHTPASLRISIVHSFSDSVVFLCSGIESAIAMYLAWLHQCGSRLSQELVKPTAHIVMVDAVALSVDSFIRACSERPEAGAHDDTGLRSCNFSALTIITKPSRSLRIARNIASGVFCSPWSNVLDTSYPCKRRREHLGRMWSRAALSKLREAWCEKLVPPNPVEILTVSLPMIEDSAGEINPVAQIDAHEFVPKPRTGRGLDLLVLTEDSMPDIEDYAIPVIASVLAQHATRSQHWSDKNFFLRQQFELRYYPELMDVFIGYISSKNRSSPGDLRAFPKQVARRLTASVQSYWMSEMRVRIRCCDRLSMARIHVQNISKYKLYLEKRVYSEVCASCILRPWSTLLPCSHGLCNLCLLATGLEDHKDNLICIENCPICRYVFTDPAHYPREPPTAAARILALDGGGVRGIVQLEILNILEDMIGLELPLTGFFDIMVGTSIGGICALGLGKQGWSVSECKEKFLALTEKVFSNLNFAERYLTRATNGWYKAISGAMKILLTDSLYDTKVIETVLQEAFGPLPNMIAPRTHIREPKVAVIVDEASSSVCKILPTYNKASHSSKRQYSWPTWYAMVRVWQAARATSAAPSYWSPLRLFGETYQDGGLDWNNPTAIARIEAKDLYPRSTDRNVTISVGCGITKASSVGGKSFFWRLWQNFNNKIDAERQHDNMLLIAEKQDLNLYRLNPSLPIDEVRLNDFSSIAALQTAIKKVLKTDRQFQEKVRYTSLVMLASLFYFELNTHKKARKQSTSKSGTILSRLSYSELQKFKERYDHARFEINRQSIKFKIPMDVEIPVTDPQDLFQINITIGNHSCAINGSPFTTQRLEEAQQDFIPLTNIYNRKRKLTSS